MANATPSRLGLKQGGSDADELFLKVFSGEVLVAFEETNVMAARSLVRTIDSGKSAQFPATWKVSAAYHTPGTELVGQTVPHSERVINVDKLLIADVFIALIDEAKNHYDVRSIYTKEMGAALGRQMDKTLLQVLVNASRAAANFTGGPAGSYGFHANAATDVAEFEKLVQKAAQTFDEADVPEQGRFLAVKPAQFYLLLNSQKLVSNEYSQSNADYANAKVLKSAGLEVVKSNNVPKTNITGSVNAEYDGNFTTTVAVVGTPQAVGTVKLLDLASEGEWDIRRQGTLLVSKYAMGHGILRPECSFEIASATR